jgi:hypothetical protein
MMRSYDDDALASDLVKAFNSANQIPSVASNVTVIPISLASADTVVIGTQTAKSYFGTRLSINNNIKVNAATHVFFVGARYVSVSFSAAGAFGQYKNQALAVFTQPQGTVSASILPGPIVFINQIVWPTVNPNNFWSGRLVLYTP